MKLGCLSKQTLKDETMRQLDKILKQYFLSAKGYCHGPKVTARDFVRAKRFLNRTRKGCATLHPKEGWPPQMDSEELARMAVVSHGAMIAASYFLKLKMRPVGEKSLIGYVTTTTKETENVESGQEKAEARTDDIPRAQE